MYNDELFQEIIKDLDNDLKQYIKCYNLICYNQWYKDAIDKVITEIK